MRASPSGAEKPIVTPSSNPALTLADAGTVTLPRASINYQIVKGAIAVGTTVNLPADPGDGDEVFLGNQLTGAGLLTVNANGRFIGNSLAASATFGTGLSVWVKFFATDNVWVVLSDR